MLKVYIETYGCQMNVADSEVVAAILLKQDYELAALPEQADLILINTCSIRDNAEKKVKSRLKNLGNTSDKQSRPILGVIGCMAERLQEKLIEEHPEVDLIAGPDSYRDLPELLKKVAHGNKGINTQLSLEETYSEINPVRMEKNKLSAFISIMRGCNNYCSYCVVPYTRGRERSRDPITIRRETGDLYIKNYKEVTLLGQNVNSYRWQDNQTSSFKDFPDLLDDLAKEFPGIRFRFATSHPKDISEKLINTIADHPNICKHIHLPFQSGSDRILKRMNRKYTSTEYLEKIATVRKIIPEASISTDIISGFCGETDEDHKKTLDLMIKVGFDFAYMFKYSERPGTMAAEKFKDDVPEEIKTKRLTEVINLQNRLSLESKQKDLNKVFDVLIEGEAKKSKDQFFGRTTQNKVVVFTKSNHKIGDYINVMVKDCTSATLIGETHF